VLLLSGSGSWSGGIRQLFPHGSKSVSARAAGHRPSVQLHGKLACLSSVQYVANDSRPYPWNGEADELQTWYADGVWWPTCAMTSKVKLIASHFFSLWPVFAHNLTKKSHRKCQNWPGGCPCHGWHCTSGQRSRSPIGWMLWLKIDHIIRVERPTNFKLGVGLLMKYNDPHYWHVQWPQRSKVKVIMSHR